MIAEAKRGPLGIVESFQKPDDSREIIKSGVVVASLITAGVLIALFRDPAIVFYEEHVKPKKLP